VSEKRIEELLERGVVALERLAADEIEMRVETKPPVCPHCNKINPEIRVAESTNSGLMAEFFAQAHCLSCNNVFYILPFQWDCVKSLDDVRMIIEEKNNVGGYQSQNSAAPV
jgi:hypothetical protein